MGSENRMPMISASLPWSDGTETDPGGPYQDLAVAVVLQAVNDYIRTVRGMWKHLSGEKKQSLILEQIEIEDFFRSGWFGMLCGYDPEKVIQNCRRRAEEQEKAAIRRKNRKKAKEKIREYRRCQENLENPENRETQEGGNDETGKNAGRNALRA